MKVLFIYPDIAPSIPYYKGSLSFGLISISSVLKNMGIQTSLIHITEKNYNKEKLLHKIEQSACDLIAFSANSSMFKYVVKYSQFIKEKFNNIPIICGGVHPTIAPDDAISYESIDMICIGEGELVMQELCDTLRNDKDISNIKNLWVKKKERIYKNEVRDLIRELDSLPFYDWSLYDIDKLHESPEGVGNYLASRSCPFKCSYCANHQIRKRYINDNFYIRFQSPSRVIIEIKALLNSYPFIKYIVFQDDILPKNKKWFEEFAYAYSQEIKIPYMCNARPELITEHIAELLKLSGCARVWLGIESGNEFIRKKILKRNISQEQLRKAFSILHHNNISTHSFNMIGLPYEDKNRILETIKINAEVKPAGIQATIFYPYSNSEIYYLCKQNGFIGNQEADDYHTKTILNLPTITRSEIEFFKRYFRILVYIYKFIYHKRLPFREKIISLLDSILTTKYLPYRFLTLSYQIPLYPIKYLHSRFFHKLYKRRALQFK